jgi:hypothetical protein
VRNEEVLHAVKEEMSILHTIKTRLTEMFSSYLGTVLENTLLKEREKEGDK